MTQSLPEFGIASPGAAYRLRPGGYLVLVRDGAVGAVSAPAGLVLVGGGQEDGETAEAAAIREAAEECGLQVVLGDRIGVADELVYAADERVYYRKRCTFFLAEVVGHVGSGEPDHELVWLSAREAAARLRFGSQRWAVAEAGQEKGP
ncbi:MAG: NUDIX domain-containing protein [Gemmataceae bacterium]